MSTDCPDPTPASLWRVPALWLVIGGPAVVVVASLATLVLAWHDADPPLHDSAAAPAADNMTPAVQARNRVTAPGR